MIFKPGKVTGYVIDKKSELLWNGLISLFTESYLVLCVAIMINLSRSELDFSTFGIGFDTTLTLLIGATLVIVPPALTLLYAKNFKNTEETRLEDLELIDKYGVLIGELNHRRLSKQVILLTPLLDFARRFFFAAALVFLHDKPWAQLAYSNFASLFTIMFLV